MITANKTTPAAQFFALYYRQMLCVFGGNVNGIKKEKGRGGEGRRVCSPDNLDRIIDVATK